mmetsp:Transcript_28456/g.92224  ORF Transcript_28456/g.92224 Transcript_28456/m.92224 type:complete len:368 (-) Transcript_28456:541-1644(-)
MCFRPITARSRALASSSWCWSSSIWRISSSRRFCSASRRAFSSSDSSASAAAPVAPPVAPVDAATGPACSRAASSTAACTCSCSSRSMRSIGVMAASAAAWAPVAPVAPVAAALAASSASRCCSRSLNAFSVCSSVRRSISATMAAAPVAVGMSGSGTAGSPIMARTSFSFVFTRCTISPPISICCSISSMASSSRDRWYSALELARSRSDCSRCRRDSALRNCESHSPFSRLTLCTSSCSSSTVLAVASCSDTCLASASRFSVTFFSSAFRCAWCRLTVLSCSARTLAECFSNEAAILSNSSCSRSPTVGDSRRFTRCMPCLASARAASWCAAASSSSTAFTCGVWSCACECCDTSACARVMMLRT